MTGCARCAREAPSLDGPPVPGPLGEKIAARVCAGCWEEWAAMEIKVINELRLNFMDPEAQVTLSRHMRDFLFPGEVPAEEAASRLDFESLGSQDG